MGKVHLKIPPFFAYIMDLKSSDWFVLDLEIRKPTTICDLLTEFASTNPNFRQAVFDPDNGTVKEGINIVLNQKLLNFPLEMDTTLNNGDEVILLPSLAGG